MLPDAALMRQSPFQSSNEIIDLDALVAGLKLG